MLYLTLTPFVCEQWRWLCVSRLDPWWEQSPLVRLIPQVLIQVGIRDLLQGLDVVHRHQVAVQVHELDARLLEGTLGEQVTLDTGQRLVRVVVRLLNQTQLLTLRLVEARLHTASRNTWEVLGNGFHTVRLQ